MGNLSFAVKMAVALAGLSGDKDKGIQYLTDAYRSNGETSVDAGSSSWFFCVVKHHYNEAMQIAQAIGTAISTQLLAPAGRGKPAASFGQERRS